MSDDKSRKRGSNAKRRRGARQKAMQALYQWDFDQTVNQPDQVIRQFRDMQNMEKVDVDYFEALFNYAVENIESIDTEISRHLDRELGQLDPIERSVLRICCTELKTEAATPYKVVVNEAVEISKDFGADTGYRYINGIADKLAGSLREVEYRHDHPTGNPRSSMPAERQSAHQKPSSNVKISVKEKTNQPERRPGSRSSSRPVSEKKGGRPPVKSHRRDDSASKNKIEKKSNPEEKPESVKKPVAAKKQDPGSSDKKPDTATGRFKKSS